MSYRKLDSADLEGKTIKTADVKGINHTLLTFTDGTTLALWAEQAVHTQFGDIPGILVDDPNVTD